MNYKAIIIDDELRARMLLRAMLQEHAPHLEVVADCENLPKGIKAIRREKPQLVFLDIEMPGHSGLELLDFFNEEEIDFRIIFVTAYNEYAIKALRLSALDYLLKPVDAEELKAAVASFEKSGLHPGRYLSLRQHLQHPLDKRIAVPSGNSIRFIDTDSICFLKADSSYTEIHFSDKSKLVVSRTLRNFEEAFEGNPLFFRCHKSYLVNCNYIVDYVKSEGGYLSLTDGSTLPISPERSAELLEKLKMVRRL